MISGEITTKGDNIKAQHTARHNDYLSQYDDSHQHISDQQYAKQLQINQYEEERIGKGGFSQKVLDGVGRPSSHNLDSRNTKQYESKEQQIVAQYTDPHKPFDKVEAQALMDSVSKNEDKG